jgi:hypothetical protein
VVINQTLANAVWPGQDAIGRQILVADEKVPREVIGIVPALKYRSVLEKPSRYLYLSMWQPYPMPDGPCVIHILSHMPLPQIAIEVQREVRTFDPNVPIFDVKQICARGSPPRCSRLITISGSSRWATQIPTGTLGSIYVVPSCCRFPPSHSKCAPVCAS